MSKPARPLILEPAQQRILERVARSQNAPHRLVQRAQALLWAADGIANRQVAARLGCSVVTVRAWRAAFAATGLQHWERIRPGRGRKPTIPDATVQAIVHATQHEQPPDGATHWSCRTMARAMGVSPATVQRIWAARGLKPHRVQRFKLSQDPHFEAKLIDVVGLYLNPPDNAVVLCVDEKSQIQALDRTQLALPLTTKHPATWTHDYKRNGTTTLFAALNVLTGEVLGTCQPRHRHQEYLRFLKQIDRAVPKALQVHRIVDNYATHKHQVIRDWLTAHPRFHCHYTPTSSSWLNLVERWFRDLTEKAIRRGAFPSVPALIATIDRYLAAHNADPKPFVWTATAAEILEKVQRGRVALAQVANQK